MVSKTITFMIVLILFSIISSLKLKTKEEVEAGQIPSIEECNKQGKYWYMFKCHRKLGWKESCTGLFHNACEDGLFCAFDTYNFKSRCQRCLDNPAQDILHYTPGEYDRDKHEWCRKK